MILVTRSTRTHTSNRSLSWLFLFWLGLTSLLAKKTDATAGFLIPTPHERRNIRERLARFATRKGNQQEEQGHDRLLLHTTTTTGWLQENFPNPETQPGQCHAAVHDSSSSSTSSFSGRLCDPDQILNRDEVQRVEDYLHTKHYTASHHHHLCSMSSDEHEQDSDANTKESESKTEIQMAVALVEKMNLAPFAVGNQREEQAAETFARYLHDKWGVGVEVDTTNNNNNNNNNCGSAGILLFLSIQDRTIYISRGAALEKYLTDVRLDKVIDNMKDLLRAEKYPDAILSGLNHMLEYIHQGPPTKFEIFLHYLVTFIAPILWIGSIFGFLCWNVYKERQKRQAYARVKSQLSDIDRAHAEALQGKYRATSCPICLEDFEATLPEENSNNNNDLPKNGSDGQPLKLLRCGHVMDETCWAEWINSGRGTVTKCPICQQDVGGEQQHQDRGQALAANGGGRQEQGADQDGLLQHDALREENEERAIRMYRRERNFRLARLAYRFPQYVRPQQIQRWTQSTYDGSLVRDPSFVQSDPASAGPSSNIRSGGSSGGGFGGGASAGGRGGRW